MRSGPFRALVLAILFWSSTTFAQKSAVAPRITAAIDDAKLTVLKGNTHPLARAEFDRGQAPANHRLDRMLLVLKRSPEQQQALHKLLDEQQDKSSPNYHKWLTAEEFGRRFGAADQDIATVKSWLQAHGFHITRVTHGRTVIEFSGTAGQLSEAFHTTLHKYSVRGQEHWANASDPQIPAALTPAVAGIATLHSFRRQHFMKMSATPVIAKFDLQTTPHTTFQGGFHALAPADFAAIYKMTPMYGIGVNGLGRSIAVVARSNIDTSDLSDFAYVFQVSTNQQVVLDGPDPGNLGQDEEAEAVLDATWAGALAPGAQVNLVVSASTDTTDGVDLSELYIVDNNLADIMTESFGSCEAWATQAEAISISQLAVHSLDCNSISAFLCGTLPRSSGSTTRDSRPSARLMLQLKLRDCTPRCLQLVLSRAEDNVDGSS